MKKTGEIVQQINLKTMILHSATFALFALSVAVNTIFYVLVVLSGFSDTAYNRFIGANFFMVVCSFFSQILLCVIFWKLGTKEAEVQKKEDPKPEPDHPEYTEVTTEDFDEEAELMARTWNAFIRVNVAEETTSLGQSYINTVTPQQIMRSMYGLPRTSTSNSDVHRLSLNDATEDAV